MRRHRARLKAKKEAAEMTYAHMSKYETVLIKPKRRAHLKAKKEAAQ